MTWSNIDFVISFFKWLAPLVCLKWKMNTKKFSEDWYPLYYSRMLVETNWKKFNAFIDLVLHSILMTCAWFSGVLIIMVMYAIWYPVWHNLID